MTAAPRPYPTVSTLLADLQAILRDHGDLPVLTRTSGEIAEAHAAVDRVVPTGEVPTGWGPRQRWRHPRLYEDADRAVIL